MVQRRFIAVIAGFCAAFASAAVSAQQATLPVQPAPLAKDDKPAKPALYDTTADGKAQIAAAVAKAKKENRRVLIQWGGNWCGWCIRLHELTKADREIARTLMYEYDVVHVDTGQPAGKNMDLAASYGADVKKHGFPYLTVLDSDGKVIANQETASLEVKNEKGESAGVKQGHDPKQVLAFLKANQAKPLEAQGVVASGIAQARESGRVVFLHFGAPWCPWCHRLDDWMDSAPVAPLLAKDFVNVKVDVDRMTGGKDVLAKYRTGKDGGIPWFVFIDGEGKTLATSDGPKGNVGFPADPAEIEHFAGMVAKSAKKLTEAEQKQLLETLKPKNKPAAPPAH